MGFTINMRVHSNIDNADGELATQLLNMGYGFLDQGSQNKIQLPFQTILPEDGLISKVFPDCHIQHSYKNHSVIEHF